MAPHELHIQKYFICIVPFLETEQEYRCQGEEFF